MALIQQWRAAHPWISDSITAIVAGSLGLSTILPPLAQGTLSSPHGNSWENPLRSRILTTLERSPGIHFRELQRQLEAANGTLRHHLNVLVKERSVTVVPVNGRTCYYAGAPAQVEILEGTGVTDEATAAAMLPVGLSGVQRKVVNRLSKFPNPISQAQLARDLGRSRATVHSAVSVLRRRGIVSCSRLSLAPHLDGLGMSKVDYPWLEIRQEYA
ncbi:MAG: winged helix-turn-helix transcriptional regulator [Candidatus Thalassarchaeaceae archaeon]|jgi:predicted transcriptional regulator|nr:winged helix-turn-helix transcriptional regulator [Candidatus Thalassarchaeaceae archaeon]